MHWEVRDVSGIAGEVTAKVVEVGFLDGLASSGGVHPGEGAVEDLSKSCLITVGVTSLDEDGGARKCFSIGCVHLQQSCYTYVTAICLSGKGKGTPP